MMKLTLAGALVMAAVTIGADTAPAKPLGKIIVNSGESLQCPAGSMTCVVTVQATGRNARNHRVALGHSTITIAPAATAKLIFTLNRTGKRLLLSRGPLHAHLTITARHGIDAPIVSDHPITIGVPKKHRGRRR